MNRRTKKMMSLVLVENRLNHFNLNLKNLNKINKHNKHNKTSNND